VASIQDMTRARLHGFWRAHYRPPRIVVAAAGNLRHERVVELVEAAFPAEGPAEPAAPRPDLPAPNARADVMLHSEDTEQAHLMLGLPALDRADPRRAVLEVLNHALGGGPSSRLFQQVREQRGLDLTVYAGCQPERLGQVAEVIRRVLAEVAAEGLTEAEVRRTKGALCGGLVLGLEDTASRMHRIGRFELEHGRQRSLRQSLAEIEAVRPEAVAELATLLLTRPLVAAVVGPYASVDALPGSVVGHRC
jgi:predicted Zn-dependent peptidase